VTADGIAGALSLRAGPRSAEQARTTGLALLLSSAELLIWRVSRDDAGCAQRDELR
jgi:hypothetical protein